MARQRRDEITERDITGLKYFDQLAPLLARLHDEGCARDRAGNRQLHYDQYCLLILLYLFNPIVTSLRGLQQASELAKVQKKLGCSRAALGSLSEATTVFDLLSHSQSGIEIQTYCAIIACLLISLWTGRKPTLRTYEMICWYFTGMASEEELLAHLAKLKAHDEAQQKK
jgi:hypothetical protein